MDKVMGHIFSYGTCGGKRNKNEDDDNQNLLFPRPSISSADEIRQQVRIRRDILCQEIVTAIESHLADAVALNGRCSLKLPNKYNSRSMETDTIAMLTLDVKRRLQMEGWTIQYIRVISVFEKVIIEYALL